jgi:hypothetical protein
MERGLLLRPTMHPQNSYEPTTVAKNQKENTKQKNVSYTQVPLLKNGIQPF